ncbi:hypothetical protein ACJIZ3_002295 [Penstemon smallii]|uniref:Uncharacterized protein n=1 Tax=Penstemon smallii TaxID=265156 RepID=A0ABD3U629_9LAMI
MDDVIPPIIHKIVVAAVARGRMRRGVRLGKVNEEFAKESRNQIYSFGSRCNLTDKGSVLVSAEVDLLNNHRTDSLFLCSLSNV